MKFSVLIFIFSFTPLCSQAFKACDDSIPVNTVQGSPITYQVTTPDYRFIVGGNREDLSGVVNKEAVKKGLSYCTPGVIECLKTNRVKKGFYDLTLTFDLRPQPSFSTASRFKISSTTLTSLSAIQCLEKVWTSQNYPTSLNSKTSVSVSVPIQIR